MKKLLLIPFLTLSLTACYYSAGNEYYYLSNTFRQACNTRTIVTSYSTEGDTIKITATCTRDK